MDTGIVACLTQRHGIAEATRNRNIMSSWALWQVRQASTISSQRRAIIAEGDFQLVLAGNRAHGRRHCPLERFGIYRPVFTLTRIIAYC